MFLDLCFLVKNLNESSAFLLGLVAILFFGCDQSCKRNVTDVANIDNRTGQSLIVTVCKGQAYGKQEVSFPVGQNGNFILGNRQEDWIKTGGPANACDNQTATMGISLTSESFGAAKFCYPSDTAANVVIVGTSETCPLGMSEQTKPVDNCTL